MKSRFDFTFFKNCLKKFNPSTTKRASIGTGKGDSNASVYTCVNLWLQKVCDGIPSLRGRRYRDGEIEEALRPVLKRLRGQHFLNWLFRGTAVGSVTAVLFLLVSHLRPWLGVERWCAGAVLGTVLATLLAAFLSRPDAWEAACQVDGRALKERVTTALELSGERTEMVLKQRHDALAHLKSFALDLRLPWQFPVKEGKVLLAAVLAAVVLSILPNPMQAEVERQVALRKEIARQEKKVERIKRELEQHNRRLPSRERQETIHALEELRRNLHAARDKRDALKALAQAEEELAEVAGAVSTRADADLKRLAASLGEHEGTRTLAGKLAAGDMAGIREETRKLAGSQARAGQEERRSLAAALLDAAGSVSTPTLKVDLEQAASALNGGSPGLMRSRLASLGSLLAGMAGQAGINQDVGVAKLALQQARMGILAAGASTGNGRVAAGGSGEGSQGGNAPGASGSGGSGQGTNGKGTGSSNGAGQGQGGGSGAGMGSGNGDNPTGNQSSSSGPSLGNDPAPMNFGNYERIFDPRRIGAAGETSYIRGQAGEGPQQAVDTPNPIIVPGTMRPYQEVVGEYRRSARESLDRSLIPPGMKDLVRDYFASLEE